LFVTDESLFCEITNPQSYTTRLRASIRILCENAFITTKEIPQMETTRVLGKTKVCLRSRDGLTRRWRSVIG